MLQSLDTVIAFVVIMTVTSLFVTVIVQMVSAALSLRGKNLANALALTFQTIDSDLDGKAYQLAARILSDPLLSDSTRTVKRKDSETKQVERDKPWHFLNPRGAMCLANAIRPNEVYAALKYIAENDPSLKDAAGGIISALNSSKAKVDAIKAQFEPFSDIAETITDVPLKEKLLAAIQTSSATLIVNIDVARTKFEALFGSAQDRAQQWFQLHTRGITIGASILIALLFQLDAIEIFHYVTTNSASRAALVANVDKIIKEADGTLDEKGGLIKRIADAWNSSMNHGQMKIDNLAGILHTGQLEEVLNKIYEQQKDPAFKTKADLLDAYEKTVAHATKDYYRDQRQKMNDLTRDVSATGFDLVPVGFWRWPSADRVNDCWQSFRNIGPHMFGILLFSALLTLGAPYWYNLLKNLASLRPALAQLVGKETTSYVEAER